LGSCNLQQLVFVTFKCGWGEPHRILHSIECGVLDFRAASFVDFLGLRTKVDSNTRTTTPATGRLRDFSIHECSPTR
jgi:hypothetical protein